MGQQSRRAEVACTAGSRVFIKRERRLFLGVVAFKTIRLVNNTFALLDLDHPARKLQLYPCASPQPTISLQRNSMATVNFRTNRSLSDFDFGAA